MGKFSHWILLSREEREFRDTLFHQNVLPHLVKAFPMATFFTFGSHRNGLATPSSDVDVGINIPEVDAFNNETADYNFRSKRTRTRLREALKAMKWSLNASDADLTTELVLETKIPLLRIVHQPSGIEFQIVASRQGGERVKLVKQFLREIPGLKQIFLVVKTALEVRGLTDPRTGGLSSSCLLVMLVASYKLHRKWTNIGNGLVGFLTFFAHFNTSAQGLAIEPPRVFPKKDPSAVDSLLLKEAITEDPVSMTPTSRLRITLTG